MKTSVDHAETEKRGRVEMRGDTREDFSRDVKDKAEDVALRAMLTIRDKGRFYKFWDMKVFLGNLVGPIKHKTGESSSRWRVSDADSGLGALAAKMTGQFQALSVCFRFLPVIRLLPDDSPPPERRAGIPPVAASLPTKDSME